jgi:glyoxylase-like metal-dependent hydrolase (beta-lactamase superfamily II)
MKSLLFTLLLVPVLLTGTGFAQEPQREVIPVAGDVYRFQNNFHHSIFVITGDGVVVTDPINADAASWLKAEIEKLTDQPITHLVYSHSDGDHASGGAAFGDVPTVVAHQNAPETIDGVAPTIRFAKAMQFSHGGKTIELTYLGPGHAQDLVAMVVRPDNVGFVVDAVATKRLFYRDFPNADVDEWTDQVRRVEALDFEILVGGHGPIGVKSDVTDGRVYLEELRAAVLQGLKAGKTVDELAESVMMEKYQDWISYDQWRELNVRGMARHLMQSGAVEQ